jgi:hypothetical protein
MNGGANSQLTAPGRLDAQTVGNLVRYWVHYDNQLATLNRQIRKLREEKQTTEAQILSSFQAANIPNPVIQIAGGRLVVSEDRHTQPLNFKMLEMMLHQYFRQKVGAKDDTDAIVRFIKENRDITITPCLKCVKGLPPLGAATGTPGTAEQNRAKE